MEVAETASNKRPELKKRDGSRSSGKYQRSAEALQANKGDDSVTWIGRVK
jgi:hypothetical protein